MEILMMIGAYWLMLVLIGLFIRVISMGIAAFFNKSGEINIKLGKPKRYKVRKTPIYKLTYDDWGHYVVEKYEQAYVWSSWNIFFGSFIPIPLNIRVWRYKKRPDTFTIVGLTYENLETYDIPNLEDFYELSYEKAWEEVNKLKLERLKYNKALDKINQEFNSNYIKHVDNY